MGKNFPEHWVETTLKEIVVSKKGKKPKALKENSFPNSSPYIDIEAFETGLIKQYADNESSNLCKPTDVLVVWDGARFGLAGFGQIGSVGSTLACLTPLLIEPTYLYKFIQRHYSTIQQKPKGMATPHVDPDLFWNLPFPLPPLNEQKRIVEKLDAILPRVKSAKARLEKIPEILKKFRQSVLAAACSGRLTEDWREGKDIEDSQSLLKRIISEKPFNNKSKKQTIETCFDENLYELPSSWIWTKFDIAFDKIFDGTHFSPKNTKFGDFMYITAKNIKENGIDLRDITYVSKEDHEKIYQHADVRYNDILYIKDGATAGIATVNKIKEEFSILSSIAVFRVNQKYIVPEYVSFFLNSPVTKKRMLDMVSGVAITRLTLTKLNNSYLALPPLEEQHEIVRRVEKLFALADSIEAKYKKALERVEKLEQSILAKAFRGELVEPDPNDEPAEELLKRILEEKAKIEGGKKTRKPKVRKK